jgi:hypothetical protein
MITNVKIIKMLLNAVFNIKLNNWKNIRVIDERANNFITESHWFKKNTM